MSPLQILTGPFCGDNLSQCVYTPTLAGRTRRRGLGSIFVFVIQLVPQRRQASDRRSSVCAVLNLRGSQRKIKRRAVGISVSTSFHQRAHFISAALVTAQWKSCQSKRAFCELQYVHSALNLGLFSCSVIEDVQLFINKDFSDLTVCPKLLQVFYLEHQLIIKSWPNGMKFTWNLSCGGKKRDTKNVRKL